MLLHDLFVNVDSLISVKELLHFSIIGIFMLIFEL
jgi:hypothetical protein